MCPIILSQEYSDEGQISPSYSIFPPPAFPCETGFAQ